MTDVFVVQYQDYEDGAVLAICSTLRRAIREAKKSRLEGTYVSGWTVDGAESAMLYNVYDRKQRRAKKRRERKKRAAEQEG